MTKPEIFRVATTTGNRDEAERIAVTLVERKLAACVQISGPVNSIYRWQDNVEHLQEWVCTVKTIQTLYDEVEKTIRELHSYDVPEILAVKVKTGFGDYLRWVHDGVK